MLERSIVYVLILLLVLVCGGAKLNNLFSQAVLASCICLTTNIALTNIRSPKVFKQLNDINARKNAIVYTAALFRLRRSEESHTLF